MSRYTMSNLIRALDKEVRRSDLILEQFDENRIVLLLPEANAKAVQAVFKNVEQLVEAKIGSNFSVGIASFPNDAITFEDLLTYAENQINSVEKSGAEKNALENRP